jgi:UDP-N-acetylmuramoylalanine--D-glutamate ligase
MILDSCFIRMQNVKEIFTGKKVAFLGLGTDNIALLEYLQKCNIKGRFTVCDLRGRTQLGERYREFDKSVSWQLGRRYNAGLDKFDLLVRSPGWPLLCPGIVTAKRKNPKIEITSPTRLFFALCPTRNVIGVTGSKGKGTTSSLIHHILKKAGKGVFIGGNIGIPMFSFLSKIKPVDFVVLELSSFQLEDMTVSPHIAVVTNFTPEHLAASDPFNPNHHKTLKIYRDAKLNILRFQRPGDYAVINAKLPSVWRVGKGKKIVFTASKLPSSLLGAHNRENIAAAVAVARSVGVDPKTIAASVASFRGLPHRLEPVAVKRGVTYINDTFATTPESSMTALLSFDAPIVLIAGGSEKNSDFRTLARLIKTKAKYVVLLDGVATPRLQAELARAKYPADKIALVKSMSEAVALSSSLAKRGDVVLLSPACASFGMFNNYKERGDLFREAVKRL